MRSCILYGCKHSESAQAAHTHTLAHEADDDYYIMKVYTWWVPSARRKKICVQSFHHCRRMCEHSELMNESFGTRSFRFRYNNRNASRWNSGVGLLRLLWHFFFPISFDTTHLVFFLNATDASDASNWYFGTITFFVDHSDLVGQDSLKNFWMKCRLHSISRDFFAKYLSLKFNSTKMRVALSWRPDGKRHSIPIPNESDEVCVNRTFIIFILHSIRIGTWERCNALYWIYAEHLIRV